MEFSNYEVPVNFIIETALGNRFGVSGTALVFPNLSVDLAGVSVSAGKLDTKVYLFRHDGHLFTISYLAKCEALLMSGRACPIVRDDLKGIALEKDELEEVETLEGTKWFHRDCLRADYNGKWRHPVELCGAWMDENYKGRVWVGDTYLCPHCGERVVTGYHCGNCEKEFEGEWVPKETLAKVVHRNGSDEYMRKRDADSLGLSVCECGNYIAEGDEHPSGLCSHCLNEDDDDDNIEEYGESHNHNDYPNFVGDFGEKPDSEKKAFGLELEVDRNSWSQNTLYSKRMNCEMAAKISGLIGRNDIRFASDGSLHDGFEIITQPHSPAAFWKRQSDWAKMLDLLVEWGYKSHSAKSCGLHVHLSRAWFGKTDKEQSLAIAKLFAFFYNRWDDISKASRREAFEYCHRNEYARLKNGEWSLGNAVLKWRDCAKNRRSGAVTMDEGSAWSHGVALNNCNKNTVEIRVGRGTLNKASFFSWIDFCLALARNASNVTIADCEQNGSAEKWLKGIRESTARYLWKKGAFKKEISALFPEVEWESDERDSSN